MPRHAGVVVSRARDAMNDDDLLRYSRHILLDEIGIEGQQRIRAARALVIGAGGLGSPVALYLGSAGIGRLTLVDDDAVDLTNLQRQIAHTHDRIGQPKVESARAAVLAIAPGAGRRRARAARRRRARWPSSSPTPTSCSTAATTSPPARPSTPPASRARRAAGRGRGDRVRRPAVRPGTRAPPTRPATPACSRPRARRPRCAARRWACSRRWSASSARCRRPRR